MLLLFSGERVTTIHLLSPLHLPDKRHGTSFTWKRHMFSSYRVPSSDCRSHASLLAAATKESGAWLHALPVSSLGLRMDDHTTRIAVGLRLGTPLCQPHICHHCGGHVDALTTHGLSCIKSQGHFSRHAAINAIIHRSLAAINVPSINT